MAAVLIIDADTVTRRGATSALSWRGLAAENACGLKDVKMNYLSVFMAAAIGRKLRADPIHPRYLITEPGSEVRFVPKGVESVPADQPGA